MIRKLAATLALTAALIVPTAAANASTNGATITGCWRQTNGRGVATGNVYNAGLQPTTYQIAVNFREKFGSFWFIEAEGTVTVPDVRHGWRIHWVAASVRQIPRHAVSCTFRYVRRYPHQIVVS